MREFWITIKDKKYKLYKYKTLRVIQAVYNYLKTEEQPNGFIALVERENNMDPIIEFEIAWIMLIDKTDFPSMDEFINAIKDDEEAFVDIKKVIRTALIEAADEDKELSDMLPNSKKKIKMWLLIATLCGTFITLGSLFLLKAVHILSINFLI